MPTRPAGHPEFAGALRQREGQETARRITRNDDTRRWNTLREQPNVSVQVVCDAFVDRDRRDQAIVDGEYWNPSTPRQRGHDRAVRVQPTAEESATVQVEDDAVAQGSIHTVRPDDFGAATRQDDRPSRDSTDPTHRAAESNEAVRRNTCRRDATTASTAATRWTTRNERANACSATIRRA